LTGKEEVFLCEFIISTDRKPQWYHVVFVAFSN
jgi:hypothetical protein